MSVRSALSPLAVLIGICFNLAKAFQVVEDLEVVKKDLNTFRSKGNNRYYAAVVESYRRYDNLLVANTDSAADSNRRYDAIIPPV